MSIVGPRPLSIYYLPFYSEETKRRHSVMQSIPFICIGAIMFGVIRGIEVFMHTSIATLMVQIVIGAIVYVVLSLGYVIVTKHELYDIWKREIRKKA